MLGQRWLQRTKHAQCIVGFSPKLASAASVALVTLRFTCAVILVCAVAALGASAQSTTEPDECKAVDKIATDSAPKSVAAPDNIEDATKAKLALEWTNVDRDGVGQVLRAFGLLATNPPAICLYCQVLDDLEAGGPDDPTRQGLYRAAFGDPTRDGHFRTKALPTLVEMVAKANNLHLKSDDQASLRSCTKILIGRIFNNRGGPSGDDPGPVALTRINSSFNASDIYVGLYQLLLAYPGLPDETKQDYANDLEKLRAMSAMDNNDLAKQVAAKISAQK